MASEELNQFASVAEELSGSAVEGGEAFTAQLPAAKGDHTISEIAI
jgi:hypothetical protein